MLRSKIFSSSFQNQRFYAQRSSPHFSNIMLRFQIFSSLFRHHRCCDLRSSLDCSHILPALMLCFSLRFDPIVPSLMLCSKIFSSILKHVWCYALRYSLHLSDILEATFQDLFFSWMGITAWGSGAGGSGQKDVVRGVQQVVGTCWNSNHFHNSFCRGGVFPSSNTKEKTCKNM